MDTGQTSTIAIRSRRPRILLIDGIEAAARYLLRRNSAYHQEIPLIFHGTVRSRLHHTDHYIQVLDNYEFIAVGIATDGHKVLGQNYQGILVFFFDVLER